MRRLGNPFHKGLCEDLHEPLAWGVQAQLDSDFLDTYGWLHLAAEQVSICHSRTHAPRVLAETTHESSSGENPYSGRTHLTPRQ